MSYNPNVGYVGPDPATRSVTDELTARFGYPARPYEFVTGWKDPGNVSGHNPDSNGITHGVDIFLPPEQNRWAADHLAARGRAGDKRVFYVIYADQIASPSTGYEFAGEGWGHWDHPHLSVWDGYWGGPCTLPAAIYNDTSYWGIAPLAGQSSGITIIPVNAPKEDTLSEADVFQINKFTQQVVNEGIATAIREVREGSRQTGDTVRTEAYSGKVFNQKVMNGNGDRIIHDQRAQIAGLTEAIKQLATGTPTDVDAIMDAAKRGAEKAIAEGVVKVDISIAKPETTAAEATK